MIGSRTTGEKARIRRALGWFLAWALPWLAWNQTAHAQNTDDEASKSAASEVAPPAAPPHYRAPAPPSPVAWHWKDSAPPDDSAEGASLHSGFFTQVQLLAGLFGVRAGRPGVSDGIVDGSGIAVALGHSVIRDRLVGYLRFEALGDQSPRSLGVDSFELGAAYFFEPSEFMLGLQLGNTTVHYIDRAGESHSATGASVAAAAGKHWPVHGGPLALGFCALGRYAALGDGMRYGALTVGLSMTYH